MWEILLVAYVTAAVFWMLILCVSLWLTKGWTILNFLLLLFRGALWPFDVTLFLIDIFCSPSDYKPL